MKGNWVLKIGMWMTVVVAAIWAGGYLIKQIESYLPYALGLGILILAAGMILQVRTPKTEQEKP
jgi:hypothetical protein